MHINTNHKEEAVGPLGPSLLVYTTAGCVASDEQRNRAMK